MAAKKKSTKKPTKPKKTVRKKVTLTRAKKRSKKLTTKNAAPKRAPTKRAQKKRAPKKQAAAKKQSRKKSTPGRELAYPSKRRASSMDEQSGDLQGLSRRESADSESVDELIEEGNAFEADVVAGSKALTMPTPVVCGQAADEAGQDCVSVVLGVQYLSHSACGKAGVIGHRQVGEGPAAAESVQQSVGAQPGQDRHDRRVCQRRGSVSASACSTSPGVNARPAAVSTSNTCADGAPAVAWLVVRPRPSSPLLHSM